MGRSHGVRLRLLRAGSIEFGLLHPHCIYQGGFRSGTEAAFYLH